VRDRPEQAGAAGVRLRRHQHRPVAPHPRRGGGVDGLADRRADLRLPADRGADGLGDVPGHRHRGRPPRRPGGAQSRGPVDPLRRAGALPGGDRLHRRPDAGDAADAGAVRRADPRRADRGPGGGDPVRRGAGRRLPVAAERPGLREDRRRLRGGLLRHPRHHRVGRARLLGQRAAEPQAVHLRPRRAGDRRRLRNLPGRAAPDAHRRCRGAGGLRRGSGLHHQVGAGRGGPDGLGRLRRRRRPAGLPRRV
ncbi:MAG: Inosine-5'-monophosphate dehydrogenase, catalytic domain, partial [uncultured Friedmanniella sp.]